MFIVFASFTITYWLYVIYGELHPCPFFAIAFCKNPADNNRWYTFDDTKVTQLYEEEDVVTRAAYLLFYVRRSLPANPPSEPGHWIHQLPNVHMQLPRNMPTSRSHEDLIEDDGECLKNTAAVQNISKKTSYKHPVTNITMEPGNKISHTNKCTIVKRLSTELHGSKEQNDIVNMPADLAPSSMEYTHKFTDDYYLRYESKSGRSLPDNFWGLAEIAPEPRSYWSVTEGETIGVHDPSRWAQPYGRHNLSQQTEKQSHNSQMCVKRFINGWNPCTCQRCQSLMLTLV